jgi:hypothetical protein
MLTRRTAILTACLCVGSGIRSPVPTYVPYARRGKPHRPVVVSPRHVARLPKVFTARRVFVRDTGTIPFFMRLSGLRLTVFDKTRSDS